MARVVMLDDWFRLHSEAGFTDGVAWLGREIDGLGEQGTTVAQLAPAFRYAIAHGCMPPRLTILRVMRPL